MAEQEGIWFSSAEQMEGLRAKLRPFLRRPVVELDPEIANSVEILEAGQNKIATMRAICALSECTLIEAKAIVDGLPHRMRVKSPDDAIRVLRDTGASVEGPPSNEWSTFRIDRQLFDATSLTLDESIELWARVHATSLGARGVIYCVSAGREVHDESELPEGRRFACAEHLQGFSSPESYLEASVALRELDEVGAEWHGVSWGAHDVLEKAPSEVWTLGVAWREAKYHMTQRYGKEFKLDDLRPRVRSEEDGTVTVDFFTLDPFGRRTILHHSDRYVPGKLPMVNAQQIALGGQGYVH